MELVLYDGLTILGVIFGAISIILTILIYNKVETIRKKQIKNAQQPYESNTNNNMNDIQSYFQEIYRITKDYENDITKIENGDYENMNSRITTYYESHVDKMKLLLEKSNRDLERWVDLDKNKREKYEKIITYFKWVINEFHQMRDDDEIQLRIWTKNHHEMLQKKLSIERILH